MTTSVVIPAFNGQKFLDANLPSVQALGADEIIIVDDASTQPVRLVGVKLIRHPKNLGFPSSVNDGFSAASGDIVILLNQDVKPDKDLLKYTLPHFKDPKVFAVTFNEQGRSWADAKIKNGFLEFSNGKLDDKIHSSFWASGGSAAFRKSYWDALGGFDPKFSPGYYEDLDISWRARNRGYEIIWDPKAKVTHAAPESTFNATYSKKSLQLIKDRNYLLCHWKNLDSKYYPSHISHLISRIFHHPGYLIPTLMALGRML
ncbi:MAG: glycosyl transferase family protein [Microgenomates group bacterium Gr01-1014_16]|nr:MAG: glycosyl transferase family protein [Microgenomates group bacterium Gr01-1014_16]